MYQYCRFILMLLMLVCSACGSSGNDFLGIENEPTPIVDRQAAIQIVNTFLEAWTQQDYTTMYAQLSPKAQQAYSPADFIELYQERIWNDLRLEELDWERHQVETQGTTVLVRYSLTFKSSILGEFTDAERLMRVIPTEVGLRIAWSRMDIFEGWSSGARLEVERIMPTRGNIYDRHGKPLAEQNGTALSVYLVRQEIPSEERCIGVLINLLGREYDDIQAQLNQYAPDTLFYVGEADQELMSIHQQTLASFCRPNRIDERSTRRYFGAAAPHVVGYVQQIPADKADEYDERGYPVDALVGVSGIELTYEDTLRGTIGSRLILYSVTDEPIRVLAETPSVPGQDVYLTLDRDLQRATLEAFAEAYSLSQPTWGQTSPGGAAVAIDVRTGAIRAMVSYPSFDPAVFNPDSPYFDPGSVILAYSSDLRRPLLNRATLGSYPLGSVFKLVSSVAAANSGVFPLDTLNVCSGTWYGGSYGDSRELRTDWFPEGHQTQDGRGAIINSCNPYYWQMGVAFNNTDPNLLPTYARMMGLGVRTGITEVQEISGQIPDQEYVTSQGFTWNIAYMLNLVIGQGDTAVNPLQVSRMVASIANDGQLLKPYLVQEIKSGETPPTYQAVPEVAPLALDPAVLAEIRQAMCDVTTVGTAAYIFTPWYEYQNNAMLVCGKTGTAEAGNNNPHAWFGSFAPADNPELAIAVIVENSCEGSEVSAPITRRMLEVYYDLPFSVWPTLWQSGCTEIGE